jgi:hypothetical protein
MVKFKEEVEFCENFLFLVSFFVWQIEFCGKFEEVKWCKKA